MRLYLDEYGGEAGRDSDVKKAYDGSHDVFLSVGLHAGSSAFPHLFVDVVWKRFRIRQVDERLWTAIRAVHAVPVSGRVEEVPSESRPMFAVRRWPSKQQ